MPEATRRYFKPVLYLRGVLFWVPFALSILVYAPLVVASNPLPLAWRYRLVDSWNRLNLWFLALLCGIRHRVHGAENLPEGAVIVFCKHQSTWETLALNVVLPKPLVWVLKRELTRIPLFGWGLASMNPIAIDRSAGRAAVQQIVEQGRARLRDGLSVIIFPEGTRVAPGARLRYRMGGAVLAVESGAPVLPIAHNAGEYWPRHSLIKWPGEVQLHIGPPIDAHGKSAAQINAEAEAWIEGRMAEITRLDRFPY